ncbi:hypothetical protein BACCAP_01711 [Pseudoflavonifractor capillosus ATCC 29799]|uniref:Uncharacterized protein n=1 Tax=Pseudoflavonifractor capillosus ATCC 29799 TaxID=411467 RepID=A6NU30_9FIRM|nr:hypothetical protein BACCAP_01711 [Pseudoflavonifractor capillosus ATCC 29799]
MEYGPVHDAHPLDAVFLFISILFCMRKVKLMFYIWAKKQPRPHRDGAEGIH